MATNPLTRDEIIRRFHEVTDLAPTDLAAWLREERKGRNQNERDPGDHEDAAVFEKLKRKDRSEIDDEDLHHMSTLINYLDRKHGERHR